MLATCFAGGFFVALWKIIVMKNIVLCLVATLLLSCKSENSYKKEALVLEEKILKISVISEELCSLTHTIWRNAVYKEKTYNDYGSIYYQKDFGQAIRIMGEQEIVKASRDSLDKWEKEIEVEMGEVNEYPEKLSDLKNELIDAYATAKQYSRLAKTPNGSLMSFTQEMNSLSVKAKESSDKIKVLAK